MSAGLRLHDIGCPPGRRDERESGQVTILSIGFLVLALVLVLAVAAATGVHLERKRLLALADQLAVGAADEIEPADYFDPSGESGRSVAEHLPLTDRAVRQAVDDYLAAHPTLPERLDGFRVLDADAVDGRSARVRVGSVSHPPLISWVTELWSDGIALEAESTARAW